jgi:acetylornithine deacetylase/succinyl-diaminopimelate desuccinylase-like protein
VRDFLLDRLRAIARGHSFIHVEDDVQTNAAFTNAVPNGTKLVYFQGKNILVKVEGTDDETQGERLPKKKLVFKAESSPMNTIDDAVLFSAHFDSVSTAPGATDDGMSIVALVQMVDFLSKNRPRRTAVFNFNNGEEDGLHGAQACATFMYRLSAF